jgi:4-aminobutyrate aminotransferase/(S)-3-amino-2-methylpropionate transaminase
MKLLSDVRAELLLQARGVGLLAGLEVQHTNGKPATDVTMRVVKAMLRRGFILLPEGEHGNVIGFTPPLTISKAQLRETIRELNAALDKAA